MTDLEFLKLLKDKKLADSYQFYDSCRYKLASAEISYNALSNIVTRYHEAESEVIKKVYEDALKKGTGTFKSRRDVVDFFGTEIDLTTALDKLAMEIMGLLHNFFDTFAQWINSSLLGEKALPIKKASLVNIIKELPNFAEYSGQFISDFLNLLNTDEYLYISDFNNTLKHRYQIYVQNKFDLFSIQGEVSIPDFSKDGRVHVKREVLTTILSDLNFCKNILDASRTYIENYYASSDCNYTRHRMYNPKTYMVFKSEDDYKKFKNPINHYYYIEVEPESILPEYQIMLASDRMESDEDKSIELYNSVYQIIMLKEKDDNSIVGILRPDDTETFAFKDEHNLIYRKYISIVSDYQIEMFKTIREDTFHYYPYLSDASIIIMKEENVDEINNSVDEINNDVITE
ncbi:hypothetical protein HYH96_02425 [Clostridium botulinum]|uniref:hypothetical protein n=1 Tax=Clostridium botulinum TaxID=1491 RepID=UPI001747F354|nr:hypothetical protein [Clostridium botulinum]MBD5642751.1 hypothetical protein [Clostridium botulinum]